MEGPLSSLWGSQRPKRHAANGMARGCQPPSLPAPLLGAFPCTRCAHLPAPSQHRSRLRFHGDAAGTSSYGQERWQDRNTDIRPPPTLGLSGSARSEPAGSRVPPAPQSVVMETEPSNPASRGAFLAWADRRLAWLEMEAGAEGGGLGSIPGTTVDWQRREQLRLVPSLVCLRRARPNTEVLGWGGRGKKPQVPRPVSSRTVKAAAQARLQGYLKGFYF